MNAPIKECKEIIFYLYVVLRGKDSKEQCEKDFNWDIALDMMTKLKALIDDCLNYELKTLEKEQWKIDMIQPAIS
jgi:hypothetical protein